MATVVLALVAVTVGFCAVMAAVIGAARRADRERAMRLRDAELEALGRIHARHDHRQR